MLQHFVSEIAPIFSTCAMNYSYCCLYEIVFIVTILLLLLQNVKMISNYIYDVFFLLMMFWCEVHMIYILIKFV
jgi:hypothetical protein